MCRKCVAYCMRWASPSNSRSAGCAGPASDASIRRKRSAFIGCVALARHPRHQRTRRLRCPYWEFLRSRMSTGSSSAHSSATEATDGPSSCRSSLVVEGMLWVARSGSSWRELPDTSDPGQRCPAATNAG